MILKDIYDLVEYGKRNDLVNEEDEVFVTNCLMELFGLDDIHDPGNHDREDECQESKSQESKSQESESPQERPIQMILDSMIEYALEQGILEDDSITTKDLFDTKIMGCITPMPSWVRAKFRALYEEKGPEVATNFYYAFSQATNYIRTERIRKDEKWVVSSEYGDIDITINLSKPEKDPRDIAKAGLSKKSGYPACLLCKENEGYAGHVSHPARQNHRIIPITLKGEKYHLQYSPYVYYNEHCIIFNDAHIPMKINKPVFEKLLDFVKQFPHYMAGSNADLPIVGGSILSHDHFQGGRYEFAMTKAGFEEEFTMEKYPGIHAGIVKWPMSVIRLQGKDAEQVAEAADFILQSWRNYSDKDAFIFSETDGVPHNTITPIARMRGEFFELDLVLRNNITTEEKPWGVYHPTEDLHHIKKENIGLIEVMGLAVLPSRLKKEMQILEQAILAGADIRANTDIAKHADWVDIWRNAYDITAENIHEIVQNEIGKVFVKVLECAGVYKQTQEGREAFRRFVKKCSCT